MIGFESFRDLDELARQMASGGRSPRALAMDAYRRGDDFIVHLDLPGVDPGSVDVTVDDSAVTVRAERPFEPQEGDEILVAERPHGMFTRQLSLGTSVDSARVEASYEDGVLTLVLPVSEAAKPRRVEVRGGGRPQSPALDDPAPSEPPQPDTPPDESAKLPPY